MRFISRFFPYESTILTNEKLSKYQALAGYGDNAVSDAEEEKNTEGPWPECIGLTGEECKAYILSQEPNLAGNVFIAYPRKFNYYRIWIYVNESGLVAESPGRG